MSDYENGQLLKHYKRKTNSLWSQNKLLPQHKTTAIVKAAAQQLYEYDDILDEHMENYNVETTALHRKLQSKIEALRILRKELDKFRTERDQFKLMAETLQLRYAALRRCSTSDYSIYSAGNDSATSITIEGKSSVAKILNETRERNIKLTTEVEALKQKLSELQGDIEILRKNKQRIKQSINKTEDTILMHSCNTNNFDKTIMSNWKDERSNMIYHLEQLKKKNAQLAFDLKTVLDEKEELINERDAYKCKTHRLNHELLAALKAKDIHPKFIDIDSILLENKYLHERLNTAENEMEITKQYINKYKSSLESKRSKGIIKLGKLPNTDEKILSHKQVKDLLANGIALSPKTDTMEDIKSMCLTLLDNLNDKNLALSLQKKTNKILAAKISEQERRLQLLTGINYATKNDGFSVSKYLLQDYNASFVETSSLSHEEETDQITNKNVKDMIYAGSSSPQLNQCQDLKNTKTMSLESEDNHILKDTCEINSDDAISSFSSESGRSILSSEYDIVNNTNENKKINSELEHPKNGSLFFYKTSSSASDSQKSSATPYINDKIMKQRHDDLKDLPPELAALVQKALNELDLRDFDEVVGGINENNNINGNSKCQIAIREIQHISTEGTKDTDAETSEATAYKLIKAN